MSSGDVETLSEKSTIQAQLVRGARIELLTHISQLLEPVMMALGVTFLALLLWMYAELPYELVQARYLDEAMQVIWAIFVADFVLRLLIAPVKSAFLRQNWLIGLSLLIPFMRPLHALQVLQALHGFTLLAFLGATNRTLRALRTVTRGRVFLYMIVVTAGVTIAGGIGVHFFDGTEPGSEVATLPDAIWWSATLVTTLNSQLDVQTTEARLIAFGLRLYGLNVFCFFMASIASYLIGVDTSYSRMKEEGVVDPVQRELGELRRELAELRRLVADVPMSAASITGAQAPHAAAKQHTDGELPA